MKLFAWDDGYLLGCDEIDSIHREFVAVVNSLLTTDDGGLIEAFNRFEEHVERHFSQENDLMEQQCFPGRNCHIDEHNKVLVSVHEVKKRLLNGDVATCRALTRALVKWFPKHAEYMDSALINWLVAQSNGTSPLKFINPEKISDNLELRTVEFLK